MYNPRDNSYTFNVLAQVTTTSIPTTTRSGFATSNTVQHIDVLYDPSNFLRERPERQFIRWNPGPRLNNHPRRRTFGSQGYRRRHRFRSNRYRTINRHSDCSESEQESNSDSDQDCEVGNTDPNTYAITRGFSRFPDDLPEPCIRTESDRLNNQYTDPNGLIWFHAPSNSEGRRLPIPFDAQENSSSESSDSSDYDSDETLPIYRGSLNPRRLSVFRHVSNIPARPPSRRAQVGLANFSRNSSEIDPLRASAIARIQARVAANSAAHA
jgi:hypothetical protein